MHADESELAQECCPVVPEEVPLPAARAGTCAFFHEVCRKDTLGEAELSPCRRKVDSGEVEEVKPRVAEERDVRRDGGSRGIEGCIGREALFQPYEPLDIFPGVSEGCMATRSC